MKRYKLFSIMLVLSLVLSMLPVAPATVNAAAGSAGARAEYGGLGGSELFLGGKYIELGISNWGDFGTEGNKPANFRGTSSRNNLGMSADHDGYGTGLDLPVDYYLPGTPEERFAVGYKVGGNTYAKSNSAVMNTKQMPTTVLNTSQEDKGLLSATIVSTWDGTMEIKQVISFKEDYKFYRNDVTIKNLSDQTWDGARYMRSMDPDNTVDQGGSYATANRVTHTVEEDGVAVVEAKTNSDADPLFKAFSSRAPIFFYSSNPQAKASVFGFTNVDPYAFEAYDSPKPKNQEVVADTGITMTWDSGALAPSESKSFTYYTSLDERDFKEVLAEIELDEGSGPLTETEANDGTVKGNQKVNILGATLTDPIDVNHIRINNLPAGLGCEVTRLSETELNFKLTGAAVNHSKEFSVDNLSVTVGKENLIGTSADLTTKTFSLTFIDPAMLSLDKGIVSEAVYGSGQISETLLLSVTGGKFASDIGSNDIEIRNLPDGLSATLKRISDKELQIGFDGIAMETEDVYNAYVTVAADKLVGSPTSLSTNTFKIDFKDKEPFLVVHSPVYESDLNDGSIADALVLELKNGIFDASVKDSVYAVNWPDGLEIGDITIDNPTQITLSIAGHANSHEITDSINNAEVTVAGIPSTTFSVLFRSPPPSISASPDVLHDAGDGSVEETLRVTLKNGRFTEEVNTGVTINNLPEGLDFTVVRISDTILEVHFTGQATKKSDASAFASVTVDPAIVIDAAASLTSNNFDLQVPDATSLIVRDMTDLTWDTIREENIQQESVTSDVYLTEKGTYGSKIIWKSTNEAVISPDGTVTRPSFEKGDQEVTLTAEFKNGSSVQTKTFILIVKKEAGTDEQSVAEDLNRLTWEMIRADNESQKDVKTLLKLLTKGSNGSSITWSTSNKEVIGTDGKVTRPGYLEGDQNVTLTATVSKGKAVQTKEFVVTVIKQPMNDAEAVSEDLAGLTWKMIRAENERQEDVKTLLKLLTKGSNGSSITWSTSNKEVIGTDGKVTRPGYLEGDQKVTLTAVVSKGEVIFKKEFVLYVKAKIADINEQLAEEIGMLRIGYTNPDSVNSVTQNIQLISNGFYDSKVVWTSHRSDIVSNTGEIQRPLKDTIVRLTARVTKDGFFHEKDFYITVKGTSLVDLPKDELNANIVYAPGDSETSVKKNIFLTTKGDTGSLLSWTSSNPDIISNTGRVSRPGPEEEDVKIVLTVRLADPEKPGEFRVKTFTVIVKKLSDQEAVDEAARSLKIDDAAVFAEGDIWESVTEGFLLLQTGKYSTDITWASNQPSVIGIDQNADQVIGKVNRKNEETNVILTATFSRNGKTATKKYLLIVKAVGVAKDGAIRQVTSRQAELSINNDGKPLQQGINILRTNMSDGTKIDTIIVDDNEMFNLVEAVNPNDPDVANRSLTISHVDDPSEHADEIAIEIPASAILTLAGRNIALDIVTSLASIHLDEASIKQLEAAGTDLYFRIVPVRNLKEQQTFQTNAVNIGTTKLLLANNHTVKVQGIPRGIETNYSGINTYIRIPLSELTDKIPVQSSVARDAFLDSLRIYVEHSDGDIVVYSPLRIGYTAKGEPEFAEFRIDKFSIFQMIQIADKKSDDSQHSGNPIVVSTAPVPVPADTRSTELTGEKLKELQDQDGVIKVETDLGTIKLNSGNVSLDKIQKLFGQEHMNPKDIVIRVGLTAADQSYIEGFKLAAKREQVQPVGQPVKFYIEASYKNQTRSVSSQGWGEYTLPVPEGMKITTGVLYKDGEIYHQPTYVNIENGRYYARINSLETGVFGLIWNPEEFQDVERHWSKQDVNVMGSRLVANGTSDTVYEPQRAITRAEFTAMMVRALGIVNYDERSVSFSDVPAHVWYEREMEVAIEYGLIAGYPDDTFRPNNSITRQEAMTIVSRAMKITKLVSTRSEEQYLELLQSFTDSKSIAKWAEKDVKMNLSAGIIVGRNERLAPNENITRAEAAAAVRRLLIQSGIINP
ncbi:S-layer homology domain-containing protein [Paenibacillus sp. FSL H8-0261]|uniref:immunoglobulin-like domain-containing protein n=1 Tax=Paenibacillus sp. FSL H8-0261 TaxID=2921381 RepID=UPI003245B137